ncbi:hypothetical protein [Clavibacter nebraskensis]|uniref:hypothetical protein n=1 Tax=Clavibacter nebraskensis TaxID=31963 RepID=UPI003F85D8AD
MLGGIIFGLLALLVGALAVVCLRDRSVLGIIGGLVLLVVAAAIGLFAITWVTVLARGGVQIPF